jgi:hypothetical protein
MKQYLFCEIENQLIFYLQFYSRLNLPHFFEISFYFQLLTCERHRKNEFVL